MSLPVRSIALVVALLLPFAAIPAGARPSDDTSGDPPGTVQITPKTGSSVPDSVVPLAGDATALLYAVNGFNGSLDVRTTDGRTIDLGSGPSQAIRRMAVVGSTVSEADYYTSRTVYYWRLPGTSYRAVTLASGERYQTGAPGGFVYRRSERLFRRTTGGKTYDLGRPIVGADPRAIADGQGLLAVSGDHAKYLTFGHPNQFRTLKTDGHRLFCTSVASGYAACIDETGEPVLVPLDGRAPLVLVGLPHRAKEVALAGSTIVADLAEGFHLYSEAYGSSTVQASAATFSLDGISALNKAIVQSQSDRLQSVTSATSTPRTVVVAPPDSPIATPPNGLRLSLSPGQVVTSDNRKAPGVPPGDASSFRTPLTTSAAHLSVGKTTAIQDDDAGDAQASGVATVYASTAQDGEGHSIIETLVVQGPQGTRSIPGVYSSLQIRASLSGDRLLYELNESSGPVYRLYDFATDTISYPQGDGPAISNGPVIYGGHIAYLAATGAVEYEDLTTGHTVEIAPPPACSFGVGTVRIGADFVSWNRYTVCTSGGHVTSIGYHTGYRDVATMSPPVDSTDRVASISDAGLVTGQAPTGSRGSPRSDSYTLHTNSGTTIALPDIPDVYSGPQISGRTEAWLSLRTRTPYPALNNIAHAEAAPLSITPAAPRFLGDPVALSPSGGLVLHDYAPYAEPLTSCSVAITNSAGDKVATLPCDTANAAYGVAEFSWDGQQNGSPVPAGTYTYAITAAGDGGPAQDAAGTTTPVTGTFTIG